MSRTSVIGYRNSKISAGISETTKDSRSDVAEAFAQQINRSLGERILPGEFGEPFTQKQAERYVQQRTWRIDGKPAGEKFAHEEYLHRCYWPGLASDYRLLIVNGKEGVGKSTLLRYYFDCYLPDFSQFPYVKLEEWDSDSWERELRRHFVLYVDLRRFTTKEELKEQLFRSFKKQLIARCRGVAIDITVDNNYAMWDRVVDWSNSFHVEAEKAFPSQSVYRANYVEPLFRDNVPLFVREAIWYLGKQRDETGNRKYYITRVLDNIDQQPRDTQLDVLKMVLDWLNDSDSNWKIILPLRPETVRELSPDLQPIADRDTIDMGDVDERLLLEARGAYLARQITASGKQVERNVVIEEENVVVYLPVANYQAAQQMRRTLTFDFEMADGTRIRVRPRAALKQLVQKFCNGSIRRLMSLRKRVVMSTAIARAIEQVDVRPGEALHDYIFLNGCITGGRDHWCKNDIDNNIVNIYDTAEANPCAYTLLVGAHVLHLLGTGENFRRSQLIGLLSQVGYTRAEVDECLNTFYRNGFFTREILSQSADYRIIQETNIVEAYLEFITNPAYTDNMAMVTPVETHCLTDMKHTVSYAIGEFRDRTRTTLRFLRQIRDDEDTICTWTKGSMRHKMDPKAFTKTFNKLYLPSIYRQAAAKYRERLTVLKRRAGRLRTVMSAHEWDKLLSDEILNVDYEQTDMPLMATIPQSPRR
jgi:hypothetical protein